MELVPGIRIAIQTVLAEKFNYRINTQDILVNETKPEFTGDYTVVLFSFSKILKTSPDVLGRSLGEALIVSKPEWFAGFNVIKGFLNLVLADAVLLDFLHHHYNDSSYGLQ